MATQVNMHEAKSQLSALVERVLAGEQVTIARAGAPVVDLVIHHVGGPVFGLLKGRYEHDDDAFGSADDEIRDMFYGAEA